MFKPVIIINLKSVYISTIEFRGYLDISYKILKALTSKNVLVPFLHLCNGMFFLA